jgi:arylsulfatase A-like enzyme
MRVRNASPRRRRCPPGLLLLAGFAAACGAEAPRPAHPVPQNLILISIDTLRADRLGAYGYARDTSPTMDALARRGVRVETVIAESSWTLPSHVSLLSGLPPAIHGVTLPTQKVASELPLLAEVLRAAGFRSFAWTGGVFVAKRFGLERGFEHWDDRGLRLGPALRQAAEAIASLAPGERFFVFLHSYDVHCPYDPPPEYARRFATRPESDHIETAGRCGNPHYNSLELTPGQGRFLSDRYDGGIRFADDLLGRFFAALEQRGVLANTLVAIVSDHGDEFLEHQRIGHRGSLYIQSLRIPWLMAGPGLEPAVVAEPAGLIDVMPTLLELLAVPAPAVRGRSLVPVLRGERAPERDRLLFSETEWGLPLYGAVVGEHHIVVNDLRARARVFDWRADPDEQADLADADDPVTQELWRAVRAQRESLQGDADRHAPESIPVVTPEQQQQLEALGYVDP